MYVSGLGLRSRSIDSEESTTNTKDAGMRQEDDLLPVLAAGAGSVPVSRASLQQNGEKTDRTSTGNISVLQKKRASSASAHSVVSEKLCLLFVVVSFGYMCAWTSLGSLISYYKHRYGAELYNNIYEFAYPPGTHLRPLVQPGQRPAVEMKKGPRGKEVAVTIIEVVPSPPS